MTAKQNLPTCARPDKLRHAAYAGAWQHRDQIERAGKSSPDMTIYKCIDAEGGSHWHVGRNPGKLKQRVRSALRGGAGNKAMYARRYKK